MRCIYLFKINFTITLLYICSSTHDSLLHILQSHTSITNIKLSLRPLVPLQLSQRKLQFLNPNAGRRRWRWRAESRVESRPSLLRTRVSPKCPKWAKIMKSCLQRPFPWLQLLTSRGEPVKSKRFSLVELIRAVQQGFGFYLVCSDTFGLAHQLLITSFMCSVRHLNRAWGISSQMGFRNV